MSEIIQRGAEAMRAKRRELIAQPLDRIWPELMRVAVEAMWDPTEDMVVAGDEEILRALNDHGGVRRDPTPAHSAFIAMINEALNP